MTMRSVELKELSVVWTPSGTAFQIPNIGEHCVPPLSPPHTQSSRVSRLRTLNLHERTQNKLNIERQRAERGAERGGAERRIRESESERVRGRGAERV